ncbi:MAG: branched-chain amino acid ABC transporter permease, partial [Candidatus Aminicenantes bacterium]|nr:branched-chain amino acid ABC transporter permease [Candidatus Aminicenantes bacterium]
MLFQFVANGIVVGCIYALMALGFGIIYKTAKVFHIAHGVVYTASAYILYTANILLGLNVFIS